MPLTIWNLLLFLLGSLAVAVGLVVALRWAGSNTQRQLGVVVVAGAIAATIWLALSM